MPGPLENSTVDLVPPGQRASGILLHITSLPSPYGVGDLGPSAWEWVQRLSDSGQRWWQILPVGPTGAGHSPYDPLSTFAGNLILVSPERLRDAGLVKEIDFGHTGLDDHKVEFDVVKRYKEELLKRAFETFRSNPPLETVAQYNAFSHSQDIWLDDFATFLAIKHEQSGQYFYNWPRELAARDIVAVDAARKRLQEAIDFHKFCQFVFFRQWSELKSFANQKRVNLLGDLPFFVSHDSAEVWSNPDLFLLDDARHPIFVAGVPPDYFSATGQLWGNPVYNWDAMQGREYKWWRQRLESLLEIVDGVRLDHFRAFSAAWHIPAGSPTAEHGDWVPGPGADFFHKIQAALGGLPFIAEDLGLITEDVHALRKHFRMPGMRVLQFAFDGDPNNIFLPEFYDENCASFTGTHDNDTSVGWYRSLDETALPHVRALLGAEVNESTIAEAMLQMVWHCKAGLAIAPLQDLLGLGSEARMNIPGTAVGNWDWRVTASQLTSEAFARLSRLTSEAGRG